MDTSKGHWKRIIRASINGEMPTVEDRLAVIKEHKDFWQKVINFINNTEFDDLPKIGNSGINNVEKIKLLVWDSKGTPPLHTCYLCTYGAIMSIGAIEAMSNDGLECTPIKIMDNDKCEYCLCSIALNDCGMFSPIYNMERARTKDALIYYAEKIMNAEPDPAEEIYGEIT